MNRKERRRAAATSGLPPDAVRLLQQGLTPEQIASLNPGPANGQPLLMSTVDVTSSQAVVTAAGQVGLRLDFRLMELPLSAVFAVDQRAIDKLRQDLTAAETLLNRAGQSTAH